MIYNDLALFTLVAKHLSFSAAAKQTDIPLSRVSRRIAELEAHFGTKLFERSTRRVRLTEEGQYLLSRCQGPTEALHEATGFTDDTMQAIEMTDASMLKREMYAVYPSKCLLPVRVRELIDFMAS